MLMYNYEIRVDKGNPVAQIYFQDLDRSYLYNRNENGYELVKKALRNLIHLMINARQIVNAPERIVANPLVCPLDWQTELRVRLSNWFLEHNLGSFLDICNDYKLRTGTPLPVKSLETLFDVSTEVNMPFIFQLVVVFKIPFKVKNIEVQLG